MFLTARFWWRMIAINAAASLLAVLAFTNVTWDTPWRRVGEAFAVSFVLSLCITPFCFVAMASLSPIVTRRVVFPLNWTILVATLVVIAVGGTLLGTAILVLAGHVPRPQFSRWFFGALKTSVVLTLVFGIFMTAYELMKDRLDEATLALRTKERDEAEARRIAAEAHLASIEARVQPHFLFNTLNSIAALVHDDPAAAERMTSQLASLMRSSLQSNDRPLVPLDEELRLVCAYLDIERVRFGDRLQYAVDLEEGTASVLVPRLALQTLVENSVKYAVTPRRQGARITVRSQRSDGSVRLVVEDDGPGFDPAASQNGHGLALLRSRLDLLFSGRASMLIDGRPGATTVVIDVPEALG
jgi:two-component system, LytTR family, sensor histidine kinase AlgZ